MINTGGQLEVHSLMQVKAGACSEALGAGFCAASPVSFPRTQCCGLILPPFASAAAGGRRAARVGVDGVRAGVRREVERDCNGAAGLLLENRSQQALIATLGKIDVNIVLNPLYSILQLCCACQTTRNSPCNFATMPSSFSGAPS